MIAVQTAEIVAKEGTGSYAGRRVLLLGGLGFIGSNLARALVANGAEVSILDNFLPDHGANWFNLSGIREQVQVHLGDLRSGEALAQLVQDQAVIFNIAAQTSHSDSMLDPLLDLDINARGNLLLLEACRHHNPSARIVFVGTRAFYGTPAALPVNEEAALQPQDVYAANRLAAEQYHLIYHRHYGLPVTSLRLGNLYGPRAQMRHPRYNVLNFFIRQALEGRQIQVYGSGSQRRDYVYVADACKALMQAGLDPAALGRVYNIGSGQAHGFLTLVEQIVELAGSGSIQQVDWPAGAKAYDVGDFVMDISRIGRELGWVPDTELNAGLSQTIEFYREHATHYWT
ncbi:MAG: NAD-dependent epimerase [Candidatus Melainabacteria bacterium HGW-Melainabacteria-1]|nr:MAG: NAD-dependent epimerase [Candidatus Melainabacteria bacterium HGW-Melainabacteria-1]